MDLIILLVLLVLTIIFFRRFSNIVYVICIIDMFLRILDRLDHLLGVREFSNLVNKYFHNSLLDVINSYTTGPVNLILVWLLLIIYIIFLIYVIKAFFRKKK
ncbi:MAG: hypothetical protein II119_04645 [Bacilli bacterium]|nr:hypothetical protein [Bacilli bacterium]MBQ6282639.1 hypothetical protein [Bacilli bacterium]